MNFKLDTPRELSEALVRLGRDKDFVLLMDFLKKRADSIGVWNSLVRDEVAVRWGQGRTQELVDLIAAYENRHVAATLPPAQERRTDFV